MLLQKVIIENYRGYFGHHQITLNGLTALIGKNDSGKSTILDALAVFFEHPLGKIDISDLCVRSEEEQIRIGCVFADIPSELRIDASATTTLADEYLLNEDGCLEIHKIFKCTNRKLSKTPQIVALAHHPKSELLTKNHNELKKLAIEMGVEEADKRSNVALRKAIREAQPELHLSTREIQLDKESAKPIWTQITKYLPEFALFRSDRPSTDEDTEVQDPLKVAIQQAVDELQSEFEKIKETVQARALDVASRTITKLSDFDSNLASTLQPTFKADPKWAGLFKLSLTGDDDIPVNKRGSGVRRLVLFSFFRAEAERLREQNDKGNIIYAIEEPETAQHPNNQVKVIEVLQAIASTENCQVLLTTHVPALASLLPIEAIRYITYDEFGHRQIYGASEVAGDDVLIRVANDLGVFPDKRVKVLVCVEGSHDLQFLQHMNALFQKENPNFTDIFNSPYVAPIALGGSTLKGWVNQHYLKDLCLPEIHIYDRDMPQEKDGSYKYQKECDILNQREDGSKGFLTQKREMENYLHLDAINEVFVPIINTSLDLSITDECDVEKEIKNATGQSKFSRRSIKHWINDDAASKMTLERLRQRNGYDEIKQWFDKINELVAQ